MAFKEILTSYIVLGSELWAKFEIVVKEQGWSQTRFVNAAIADFFRLNIDYYLEVAKIDAEARGYSRMDSAYYQALLEADLQPWGGDGARPDFPDSPLKRIADAGEARKNQHRLKQIRVSEYNAALVRLALEVDDLTLIQLLSRIVTWHFDQYWKIKGGYQWQMVGAEQERLEPEV